MFHRLVRTAAAALVLAHVPHQLAAQQTGVGILGGVNWSTFGGDDAEGSKSRSGAVLGIQLVRPLTNIFALEVDALWANKGAKSTESGGTVDFKLSYVELPFLLRLGPDRTSGIRPFGAIGASVGFRVGCSLKGREGNVNVDLTCDELEDQGTELKDVETAALIGGGVDADVGRGTVSLVVRYAFGLSDIGSVDDVQNRVFSVLAGYRIPLGRP